MLDGQCSPLRRERTATIRGVGGGARGRRGGRQARGGGQGPAYHGAPEPGRDRPQSLGATGMPGGQLDPGPGHDAPAVALTRARQHSPLRDHGAVARGRGTARAGTARRMAALADMSHGSSRGQAA